MSAIIYDFSDIKRRALFPANRPQDAGTPVIPAVDYSHMVGGYFADYSPLVFVPMPSEVLELYANSRPAFADTAPSEYCPPDFDPA